MKRLLCLAWSCALAACDSVFAVAPPVDGSVADADDSMDAPVGGACFGRGFVAPCFDSVPEGDFALAAVHEIDTSSDERCATEVTNVDACVIAAGVIRIEDGAIVRVIGARPLVLVATTTIYVGGTLDIAGRAGLAPPGGSATAECFGGTEPAMEVGGAGGGYGGTYGSVGGSGGAGAATTAAGGIPSTMQPSGRALRGGCAGGTGGGTNGPEGGIGGGAIALLARESITINGWINASGGGGGGGGFEQGGGGGGAGGTIVLDAKELAVLGEVFANGGGGGEGGGTGNVGFAGSTTETALIGGGGGFDNAGGGGNGGNGAHHDVPAGIGAKGSSGGGGGGGGGGAIFLFADVLPDAGVRISPVPRT